ncbi:hypothetical protein Vretimale_15087 [Volvox reticuliferus]|uniref:Uncharacterized protein n=1 Tax=Volvox reticuliferus TaxID=1737510 RepID=A0A8J4LVC8_9CHLO|nr:hypothetical protein Vretifemale_5290 [Volvox reticuliferus]GIM11610.1 hypothetical protein Vretimale_15087 [Volvox reticuliferus]
MEEREKLEMIIRDLEAEIRVLSAKAESAEDTEDKKFYRALLLKKEDRLLKEKEKEVLLLEKDKDLRKERLMRLEMQGARGEIGSAAGLGVESTTGSGAPAAPQNAASGGTSGGVIEASGQLMEAVTKMEAMTEALTKMLEAEKEARMEVVTKMAEEVKEAVTEAVKEAMTVVLHNLIIQFNIVDGERTHKHGSEN